MIGLNALQGRWDLRRRIEDFRAGVTGQLVGEAIWQPDGTGLRQVEHGMLTMGQGAPVQASRVYLWRSVPGGGFAVLFEDGRPFHRLTPDQLTDSHDCPPDTYGVRYDFAGFPTQWVQTWRVTGPRKDYMLHSTFTAA